MVRFGDEEIKHQELFRRVERMCASGMPPGYTFAPEPNAVASAVLSKSSWAVLALICHIELFVLSHYRESIEPGDGLSELFKDVFLFHWKDECQHAVLDELELKRHDATLDSAARDSAVDDFITLVGAVDGILQVQADADARYFAAACGRPLAGDEPARIAAHFLKAYRWQYVLSGAGHPRFQSSLKALLTGPQMERIGAAVASLA